MFQFICRRCAEPTYLVSYDDLRAHLRARHRVKDLLNSEISLYETYPGSRFLLPPPRPQNTAIARRQTMNQQRLPAPNRPVTHPIVQQSVPAPILPDIGAEVQNIERQITPALLAAGTWDIFPFKTNFCRKFYMYSQFLL